MHAKAPQSENTTVLHRKPQTSGLNCLCAQKEQWMTGALDSKYERIHDSSHTATVIYRAHFVEMYVLVVKVRMYF